MLVQRKAGRSGNAAHHLLYGAGSGIINVYRACSGVGQQLGAQGAFQPLFRALLPDHGKVDLTVRTDLHGRKGSQRGTVDLRDQLSCRARQRVPPAGVRTVSHRSPAASNAKPVSSPSTLRMTAALPPSVRTRSLVRFFREEPFHAAA